MKSGLMQNRLDAVYFIDWSLKQKTAMVVYFQTLSLDGTKNDSFRGEERKDQIKRKPSPKDDLVSSLQNDDIGCFCLFSQAREIFRNEMFGIAEDFSGQENIVDVEFARYS